MVLTLLHLLNAHVTRHCMSKLHSDCNWNFHCVHGVVICLSCFHAVYDTWHGLGNSMILVNAKAVVMCCLCSFYVIWKETRCLYYIYVNISDFGCNKNRTWKGPTCWIWSREQSIWWAGCDFSEQRATWFIPWANWM